MLFFLVFLLFFVLALYDDCCSKEDGKIEKELCGLPTFIHVYKVVMVVF